MQMSAVATKERRSIQAQHQAKIEEAVAQTKKLRNAMKNGQIAAATIMGANNLGSRLMVSGKIGSKRSLMNGGDTIRPTTAGRPKTAGRGGRPTTAKSRGNLKQKAAAGTPMGSRMSLIKTTANLKTSEPPKLSMREMTTMIDNDMELKPIKSPPKNQVVPITLPEITVEEEDEQEDEEIRQMAKELLEEEGDGMEYEDDGYIELILRSLAFMCDGQNKIIQDYLRDQPDNIKSFNLVGETASFLSLLYAQINEDTVPLVIQLFSTLVEFTSGNLMNQAVVFDNKICDYVNHILRTKVYQGVDLQQEFELKETIGNLIMSLIEENVKPDTESEVPDVAKEVTESIDVRSLYNVAIDCFKFSQIRLPKGLPFDAAEMKENANKLGFLYFHIICRYIDIQEDKEEKIKTSLCVEPIEMLAWQYYNNSTLSVEVLMDDVLQRTFFKVENKSVLREEIQEKFNYEVDRSSPSNKLRDFMAWAKDIIADIQYQRKILANPIGWFFVRGWTFFNYSVILLSLLISIVVLITWKNPTNADGSINYGSAIPVYDTWVTYFIYGVGGLHNLLCLFILISYFLSNKPSLPKCRAIRTCIRKVKMRTSKKKWGDTEEELDFHDSYLEVQLFSFRTLYYCLILAMSVLGTMFYGYFFAFHLLHLAANNNLLGRVMLAVTKNGKSLIWVFIMMIILFYIYALISFAFYRSLFDSTTGLFCTTMYQCAFTMVHRGMIDGFAGFVTAGSGLDFNYHLGKAAVDISFYIIITTIVMNIVFGIIVDTFSELRDAKWQVDNDMAQSCFICSRASYDFEHQADGFEHHYKNEHNQWSYLFFLMHLKQKKANDYTAIELTVSKLCDVDNYDFFPINRAISLQQDDDNNEMRMQRLMKSVEYLVNKVKDDEAMKQRELERKRQAEWQEKHKGAKSDYKTTTVRPTTARNR